MALTENEKAQLDKLMAKQSERLTDKDLQAIQVRVNKCYEYMDAFKALMIWNRFTDNLAALAKDNERLVSEVRALREDIQNAKGKAPGDE